MPTLLLRVPPRLRALAAVLLFGVAYYALSELGISLVEEEGQVAVLWPASGLALGVFALAPRRWWAALAGSLFTANLTANFLTHGVAPITFQLPVINTLEPILGASLLLWVAGRERRFVYGSARGVAGLLAAATISNSATALLGAWAISASFGAPLGSAFLRWWIGDGLGMLAVAPLIFAWGDRRRDPLKPEGAVLLAAMVLASVAVVFPDAWGASDFFARGSVLLPLLIWTAIRAQPRVTSAAILMVAIILTLGTLNGRGPFVGATITPLEGVGNLQVFLAVAALLALMVEGVLATRRRTEHELAATSEDLDSVLRAATEFSIIGTDINGAINVFNAGAERILGYNAEEMMGLTPAAFHDPAEIGARARELGVTPGFEVFVHAARRGHPETRQWTYILKSGERIQISLTVTPRLNAAGDLAGFIGIARDVSGSVYVQSERAALVRASRAVAADPLPEALEAIAEEVGRLNSSEVAAVTRFDTPEHGTVLGSWSTTGWLSSGREIDLTGPTAAAIVSREGGVSRTRAESEVVRTGVMTSPSQERLGVPITSNGRLWGAISVGAPAERDLGSQAEAGLLRFAHLAGLAITNSGTRDELERSRDELSAIVDGLPALVWVRGLNGELLLTNNDFDDLSSNAGLSGDGGEMRAAFFDDELERRAIEAGETTQVEQTLVDGAGRQRTLLVSRSPLRDGAGETYALTGVATDITARSEIERHKDEFIGVISHELRTPLSSIRGALSLLSEDNENLTDDARARMIEIASSNSERLVALINDILDLQRIESGAASLELGEADTGMLAAKAAEAMESLAGEKGIEIVLVPGGLPILVDADRVIQVLNNFLSNAVKFSESGSRIEIGSVERDGEVGLFVRDRGRGIPEDKLEMVFERFQQVDSSDSRTVGGTGLGLAICRQIAEQHGGHVWVESEMGVGSCFWLAMPLSQGEAEYSVEIAVPEGEVVLICDDDPISRGESRKLVEGLGFTALEASDGKSAASLARAHSPGAILLDLVMPQPDGLETLSLLAADDVTAAIPVVVVSVLPPDEIEHQPVAVVDWITKPTTAERLIEALSLSFISPDDGQVLIVEDDSGLADVLLEQLRRDEIPAVHVRTAREAIASATRLRPDLIVLDIGLPDGDGFEVVEELRQRGIAPQALVVYSALELTAADRERLKLGATDFFTKSRVSPLDFHERLAALVSQVEAAKIPPSG